MKAIILTFCFAFTLSFSTAQTKCNCCTETHEQFDFWIGEWTVTNPDGSAAGKNSIEKIQNKLALEDISEPLKNLPRTRDYYRVEDVEGRRYWLFRLGLYGDGRGGHPEWFMHGLFA